MSKKDYEAIAKALSEQLEAGATMSQYETIRATANRIADIFEKDNPRFNRARFLEACNVS